MVQPLRFKYEFGDFNVPQDDATQVDDSIDINGLTYSICYLLLPSARQFTTAFTLALFSQMEIICFEKKTEDSNAHTLIWATQALDVVIVSQQPREVAASSQAH